LAKRARPTPKTTATGKVREIWWSGRVLLRPAGERKKLAFKFPLGSSEWERAKAAMHEGETITLTGDVFDG
jgi:hypothetical protein